jgi:DNA-binding MarR family transcriptional regulator
MDVATVKGVVERLAKRGLIDTRPDPTDRRRVVVSLTEEGLAVFGRKAAAALAITEETLAPLSPAERDTLAALLARLR